MTTPFRPLASFRCASCRSWTQLCYTSNPPSRRSSHISASSSSDLDSIPPAPRLFSDAENPDAKFEIINSPFSLLSVSLRPSQSLFFRRGTLVGVGGNPENVTSTLSILKPFRRAALRLPFLYQRITSSSPVVALVSTKPSSNSLAVIYLNGTKDWMLSGKSLLAWTGDSLLIKPHLNRRLSLAHWGSSSVTGRGIVAVAGGGSICQVNIDEGDEYVIHPSNVIAYTINSTPPSAYRLKSSTFRLQVPSFGVRGLSKSKFINDMRNSDTWRAITKTYFSIRTWSRRTIWGDRLFLQFHGPTSILLQTRAARLHDVLSKEDANEIAETAPGVSMKTILPSPPTKQKPSETKSNRSRPSEMSLASVDSDGKVTITKAEGDP